jgi:hypothetical protein
MLATFNGTWDWTAVGTLALAVVTLAAVIIGTVSLRQTRKAIALSREEVEEAHRPVVVPVIVPRPLGAASVSSSRGTVPTRPSVIAEGLLAVPVQNIGSGPALNITATVKQLTADHEPWRGPFEPQTPGTAAGIGRDQIIRIVIRVHGWEERWSFELTITYEDVAGKKWSTVGRYIANNEQYLGVAITATDERS